VSEATRSAEAYNAEILSTLKRILAKVDAIESRMSAVGAAFSGSSQRRPSDGGSGSGGDVASDRDLDGQYGDPQIRFDPKRWVERGGDSFVGCRFSEAPAEYLDELASFLDWSAGRDEKSDDEKKRKNARYRRTDAARARGWAKRKRDGWQPAGGGNAAGADWSAGDDDIPF